MDQGSIGTSQRRLAIRSDAVSVDLVVPASVPVESLIPSILEALGVDSAGAFELRRSDGTALETSKTLQEMGIRDGCTLFLVRAARRFQSPPCDDAAEAVSATVTTVEQRWTRPARRTVAALVSGCMAGVAAVLLTRAAFVADAHRVGCGGVAATIGLLALLAAGVAYRVLGEPTAGMLSGLTGVGFAALAGLFLVPGGLGAANGLLAAAAAAAAAAVMRVFACHTVVFTSLACLAGACATTAAVGMAVAAPLSVIAAGSAALSLAVIEAAAPLSIALARLSAAPVGGPDSLPARVDRARTWLTSLIAGFSASAALGAVGATRQPGLPGIVFATVVGGVLMLRARTHRHVAQSVPLVAGGAATLCAALVAAALAYPRHALPIATLSMTLSVAALYLGFMNGSTAVSATGRRTIELAQYFALATVAPLAFWLCGLYGAARSLNLP